MSFETMSQTFNGLSQLMDLRKGTVLAKTSWWRRWRKTERWAIVVCAGGSWDDLAEVVWVDTGEEADAYDVGGCRVISDPDRWPDEVCCALARLML